MKSRILAWGLGVACALGAATTLVFVSRSGAEPLKLESRLRGLPTQASCIGFSPDGTSFVVAGGWKESMGQGGYLWVVSADTLRPIIKMEFRTPVIGCAFTPAGDAVGYVVDDTYRVWSVPEDRQLVSVPLGIWALHFTSSDRFGAAYSADTVIVLELATGDVVGRLSQEYVQSTTITPDALITADNQVIRRWSWGTWKEVAAAETYPTERIMAVEDVGDGSLFVRWFGGRAAVVAADSLEVIRVFQADVYGIHPVRLAGPGVLLLDIGSRLEWWSVAEGRLLGRQELDTRTITAHCVSPDGQVVIAAMAASPRGWLVAKYAVTEQFHGSTQPTGERAPSD
jgi:hypothetical protein